MRFNFDKYKQTLPVPQRAPNKKDLGRANASAICPIRLQELEHVIRAERMVQQYYEAHNQPIDPWSVIFDLATALAGGRSNVMHSPGNFVALVHALAFDPHLSPSPSWPYSQAEMSEPIKARGISPHRAGALSKGDALKIVSGDQELTLALSKLQQDAQISLNYRTVRTSSCQHSAHTSFDGSSSVHVEHTDGLNRQFTHAVETLGRASLAKERIEMEAGIIVREAIMKATGEDLGAVSKHDREPGDVCIECPRYVMEHTRLDSRPWSKLAQRDRNGKHRYEITEVPQELFAEFLRSLGKKGSGKYPDAVRAQLVLIVDGCGLNTPLKWIAEFARVHCSEIAALGYREIWYVSHNPRTAIRLDEREAELISK